MSWRTLLTYWRAKHRAGQLPARADLDPLIEIPGLVPNIFLIDRVGDAFRLRLVGSELALRARTDLTGTIVNAANIDAPGVEAFVAFLGRAARDRVPVLYASAPGYQSSNGAIGVILPLADDGMLLGGLFFDLPELSERTLPLFLSELTELVIPNDLDDEPLRIRF